MERCALMMLPEIIERSPKLALYQSEISDILERERQAREQFWAQTPEVKAEFINGEGIVTPPARFEHTSCQKLIMSLLNTYVTRHALGYVGFEKMLISLTRNDYEPDIAFWSNTKAQHFKLGQIKFPAPDLIVEVISPSTETNDRGIKMEDYAAHGVAEYWLALPIERVIEQYRSVNDSFQLHMKSGSGEIVSSVISGFTTPIVAFFDEQVNLSALRAILA